MSPKVGWQCAKHSLYVCAGEVSGSDVVFSPIGLSGGERKRLNIATELVFDPSILFLVSPSFYPFHRDIPDHSGSHKPSCLSCGRQDEPTSGLDAVMGEMVCLLLQQLACSAPKRIVMAAIHTPSSKMFTMFTHLLILTSHGQLAYMGPRTEVSVGLVKYRLVMKYVTVPLLSPKESGLVKRYHLRDTTNPGLVSCIQMLPFLEGLGFVCPGTYNPADFVLELASAKVRY